MAKTKREYFAELRNIVSNNTELVAFIDHEVELLDKKNKAPKLPTAKQVENESLKDIILAHIGDKSMTVSEIQKDILGDKELSNQRVSALVRQLKDAGKVERIEEKRKAYFSLA